MARPKSPQRIYAEELCRKDKNKTSDWGMAKLLFNSKFKNTFSSFDLARTMIRDIKGHHGDYMRKHTQNKEMMTKPSYSKTYLLTRDSEQYRDAAKRKLIKAKYYIIAWAHL